MRAGGPAKINDLAMKTRYSFEFWDLCGTSYGPFPLDAPRLMRKTKSSSSLSDCNNACAATVTQAQRSPSGWQRRISLSSAERRPREGDTLLVSAQIFVRDFYAPF